MQSRSQLSSALFSLGLAIAGLLAATGPLEAADAAPPVFEVISGRLEAHPADAPEAAPEAVLQVDVGLIQSDPDAVSVPLPGGGVAVARRTWWDWLSADEYHWFGELDDSARAEGAAIPGSVSFHYYQGRLTGTLRTGGAEYRLVPEDGLHRLVRSEAPHGTCGLDHLDVAGAGLKSIAEGIRSLPAAAGSDTDCVTPASNITIDVMVLHPLTVAAQDAQDYASGQVAEANAAFGQSQVKITYSLRHVGPITGLQPPGPITSGNAPATRPALDWLNAQFATPAIDTEVELLRKAYGADMIVIVVPLHEDSDNCGVANLVESRSGAETLNPGTTPFGTRAFSAVELNCGNADFTFAHELGHNYGMRHEDDRSSFNILPWSYGYEIPLSPTVKMATVMACVPDMDSCQRVRHFSNPDVPYQGVATGLHSSDPSNLPAHNACVANLRRIQYRNFAVRPATPAPVLMITSPPDGETVQPGVAFTLAATATDSPDGNLASQVQWSSDRDGFLGSGSPRSQTLFTKGQHLITATVTDSTGTTVPYSIRLTVFDDDPPRRWIDFPSHNQVITAPTFEVKGWATDASRIDPNGFTFKVDGAPVNLAGFLYGISRPDVCAVHADLKDPNCPFVGFRGILNLTQFSFGTHTLTMTVKDLANPSNTVTFNRTFRRAALVEFSSTGDAWTSEAQPTTNFGTDTSLQMRATGSGQAKHAYVRFPVSGITRPVLSAKLRLRTQGTAFSWYSLYWMQDNSWNESTINWNNGPLANFMNIQYGFQPANSTIELDVTPIVGGNGTYTFGMVGPNVPGLAIFSEEALASQRPKLQVVY